MKMNHERLLFAYAGSFDMGRPFMRRLLPCKLCYNERNYRKDDNHERKTQLIDSGLGCRLDLRQCFWLSSLFNSPLAANSNYRPINFGMGYEMYVDLSSLETIKDNGQGWILRLTCSARRKIRDVSKEPIP